MLTPLAVSYNVPNEQRSSTFVVQLYQYQSYQYQWPMFLFQKYRIHYSR